jgi:hypothetical protein
MSTRIQQGDTTDRLRRSLGIRGPYSADLEPQLFPTVNLADLGEAPYALDPAHGAGYQSFTSQAANQATVGIVNEGPEGSVFLVEQLVVSVSVATLIEVSRSGILQTAVAALDSNQMADTTSQARPGATGRDLPVRIVAWDANIVTVGSICEVARLAVNSPLVLPVKHLLRRGEVCYCKSLSNQIGLTVGVSGRFWSSLGDTGA